MLEFSSLDKSQTLHNLIPCCMTCLANRWTSADAPIQFHRTCLIWARTSTGVPYAFPSLSRWARVDSDGRVTNGTKLVSSSTFVVVSLSRLKIHLANLFGYNKVTLDERVRWSEARMADIMDSASLPETGARWWLTAEKPVTEANSKFPLISSGIMRMYV